MINRKQLRNHSLGGHGIPKSFVSEHENAWLLKVDASYESFPILILQVRRMRDLLVKEMTLAQYFAGTGVLNFSRTMLGSCLCQIHFEMKGRFGKIWFEKDQANWGRVLLSLMYVFEKLNDTSGS